MGRGTFSPPNASSATWREKFTMKQMTTNVSFVLKNIKYTEKIMMAGMNQRKGKERKLPREDKHRQTC